MTVPSIVEVVCARATGVNAPKPKNRQIKAEKRLFCRLEEDQELATNHQPERRICNLPVRSVPTFLDELHHVLRTLMHGSNDMQQVMRSDRLLN